MISKMQFRLSIVQFLIWSCCVTLGTLGCLDQPSIVQVDIPDLFAVRPGDRIKVPCRLKEDRLIYRLSNGTQIKLNSSMLRFKINDTIMKEGDPNIEVPDDLTIYYVKENATDADNRPAFCSAYFGLNDTAPGCHATIRVGTAPKNVQNFSCIDQVNKNLTCSWFRPHNSVPTKYTFEMEKGLSLARSWIPVDVTGSTDSWSKITLFPPENPPRNRGPTYDQLARQLNFRINGTNALGQKSWSYSFEHGAILKLTPVRNLMVKALSSKEIDLSWQSPEEKEHGYWRSDLEIVYKIEISHQYSEEVFMFETIDTSRKISDLKPNVRYSIEMRAITNYTRRNDLFSDPVNTTFTMGKAIPDNPPSLNESSFRIAIYNDVRVVTLLFDEVPVEDHNADGFEYVIQVCSVGPDRTCKNFTTNITNFAIPNLSLTSQYEINVWSTNEIGPSLKSSQLLLASQTALLPAPQDVIITFGKSGDVVTISWKTPLTIRNNASVKAVVIWCESHDQKTCKSRVESEEVPNADIYSREIENPRDYIYGVALVSEDKRSSGSVWSVCENFPDVRVGRLTDLEAFPDTDTTLKLRWKTGVCFPRKEIAGYELEYCIVDDHVAADAISYPETCQHYLVSNSSNCTRTNFTVTNEDDFYMMSDLTKNKVYRFVLRALDSSGKYGPDSLAVCAEAKLRLAVHLVVGIAVGSALGLMVLVFSLYILAKWMQKKLELAKLVKVQLPGTVQNGVVYNNFQKRPVELRVFETNDDAPNHEEHAATMLIEAQGSNSGLDKLIIDPPSVTVESSRMSNGSEGSPNLNSESTTLINNAAPARGPSTVSMPPYTQLGLSGSHIVSPIEQPGNTGYSQLSVVQTPPVEVADDSSESSEQESDEVSPGTAQPHQPAPARGGGYVTLDQHGRAPAASSNGYVPAVRANQ